MAKFCKTCGRDVLEHPYIIEGVPYTRYCDLILVEDRMVSGKVKTVEVDEDPYKRTKENNRRYVHPSAMLGY